MKTFRIIALALIALGALWVWNTSAVSADGLVVIDCPTINVPPPTPCPPNARCIVPMDTGICPAYLRVKNHNVTVTIENQVARTKIDQIFVNDSDAVLEGTYIFPLPDDAAISDFAMYVDGVRLEGKVLDREQAREIYEGIVRRQRDPALLEYIGRGAFQARIFPIPPHSEKRVDISYAQILKAENGLVKYVYPLSTEKFSPQPLGSVSINVDLKSAAALKAIYSPTHNVSVSRENDFHARIGYEASNVKPDRDFVLYYSVSEDAIGATLLTYKPDSSTDGFFLLLVNPKVQVEQQQVVEKDVILVLDTSGSMQGEKIVQARNAAKFVLNQLQPQDRFSVITFATGIISYAPGKLSPSSERGGAIRFVENIAASGSTNINRSLLEAMAIADKTRPTIVIFLTDGLPTVDETNTERIIENVKQNAPSNVRLFTFGVGDDVNTLLLDSLAEKHRGTSAYVRPGEDIEETVSGFYAKISTPVLSDLKIDFGGIETYDAYPFPLPDLFAGTQLVIAGRYKNGGAATIALNGNVNNQTQRFAFEDLNFKTDGGDEFIAPLWATRKIGYLLAQIRLHGENREAVDEIVALAIRYGIVTPYTSFLIQEDADVLSQDGRAQAGSAAATRMPVPSAPQSGPGAVIASQANKSLQEADAAPSSGEGKFKHVGDKAFILRNGIWTDTTFVPEKMTTTKIVFGSSQYFDLLKQHPEWSKYVAVGERVIFVVGGVVYEIAIGN
ncbi:MAG: VWA domain-containing protein [Chloroflexota bacterium]|nr:MAG: VWA domain-containing protein [Chloroflexota bacterium]